MINEPADKILNLYDRARTDAEYMALHTEYAPAQKALADLLERLTDADRDILDNYLHASVALFHRLLDMALASDKGR